MKRVIDTDSLDWEKEEWLKRFLYIEDSEQLPQYVIIEGVQE